MNAVTSAILGLVFLGLSFAATFLMYYLWGFPFDKTTRTSAAPKSLMRLHRFIGYAYATVYLFMMTQMVPRLWEYQVEFPARTVAHLLLGYLIGIVLIVKIAIMRFYRHLEEWMPYLGTLLFACTVLLLGLSLPSAVHERALAADAVGGGVYSLENRKRVAVLLSQANFPAGTTLQQLATEDSLHAGRTVLLEKCVRCHDLKTVLAQPRTPSDWLSVVSRMAAKPALFTPITESDQWHVSAYLIAITPDLQKSMQRGNKLAADQEHSQAVIQNLQVRGMTEPVVDLNAAYATFEKVCSQCHAASDVDRSPPKTAEDVNMLIQRMSNNGMHASPEEIRSVSYYLSKTFIDK